jgi:hypothetical protein
MSYRPICDTWILARSKVKYYGAYPAGFLGRARALLGVGASDPVLHVCSGMVEEYPYAGFGGNDYTLDLDPDLAPDFLQDARDALPACPITANNLWPAILIDRPYSEIDAAHYAPGATKLPDLNDLLKRSLQAVAIGGKVGTLDYLWPHPGKWGKEAAVVAVGTGRNNRARWYCVFERMEKEQ